ncbi:D-alanyl-D-alanine carboxypeptidase [Paenibacillus castaneae]|uniref:M15 family metallopeptidase n=1 Tax=Paenibacillus castaneae TaxID=474957 RepID=UPI001FBA6B67|nr:M15 family metallopeptidase [Paenibacillus castaneae]NIK79473.1 D-alanyl-D-alanine carboxypeptidase [Paenibacillus castaneae]
MKKRRRRFFGFIILCAIMVIGYSIINKGESTTIPPKQAAGESNTGQSGGEVSGELGSNPVVPGDGEDAGKGSGAANGSKDEPNQPTAPGQAGQMEDGRTVIAQPESISVLVNKQNKLPENYSPADLVYPDVRFVFKEKVEKRMMRKEAAEALERLFKAAEDDGVLLAGVSAYRAHSTQKSLFERYAKRDGEEKALTYSAFPGTSEHETGLAIDVSGSDGKCAAADCFGDTKEALWLEKHAHEYGFIIRYLKGKESITGYQYEPWHLRYVGTDIAAELAAGGETLEEYFGAVPVVK